MTGYDDTGEWDNEPGYGNAIEEEAERLRRAAEERQAELHKPTTKLEGGEDEIPFAAGLAFGTRMGAASVYVELPAHLAHSALANNVPRWRIELHDLAPGISPLGLDIIGDTVIGRGLGGSKSPDLDLDTYGAMEQGVSRRHALLRPTHNRLYIIDLGSTNGTKLNAAPLGGGVARALSHDDTVTLGRFTFTVKLIDGPGLHDDVSRPITQRRSSADKTTKPLDADETRPLNPDTLSSLVPPFPHEDESGSEGWE